MPKLCYNLQLAKFIKDMIPWWYVRWTPRENGETVKQEDVRVRMPGNQEHNLVLRNKYASSDEVSWRPASWWTRGGSQTKQKPKGTVLTTDSKCQHQHHAWVDRLFPAHRRSRHMLDEYKFCKNDDITVHIISIFKIVHSSSHHYLQKCMYFWNVFNKTFWQKNNTMILFCPR